MGSWGRSRFHGLYGRCELDIGTAPAGDTA